MLEAAETCYGFAGVPTDPHGSFLAAWTRHYPQPVQAQRFGCVFCDGFESGDTNRW